MISKHCWKILRFQSTKDHFIIDQKTLKKRCLYEDAHSIALTFLFFCCGKIFHGGHCDYSAIKWGEESPLKNFYNSRRKYNHDGALYCREGVLTDAPHGRPKTPKLPPYNTQAEVVLLYPYILCFITFTLLLL